MSPPSSAPVARAGALWALQLTMLLAAALAIYLGGSHVLLTHGSGAFESICSISIGFDCDAVNTSDWSEIGGVPISFYALPLHGMVFWLAWIGRRGDERGRRARGGAVVLLGGAVAFSAFLLYVMVAQVGSLCLFCLALDALHLVGLGLALSPPGGRRPALPEGLDVFACFASIVLLAGTSFQLSLIYGEKLDREAAAAVMGTPDILAETDVRTERKDGRVVTLPQKRWDVPIDRFDPFTGPRRADVTVVTFADFECTYCKRLEHALAPLRERYADRVRFVSKHYPLDQACNSHVKKQRHPDACLAATASICAQDQGAWREFHDMLFRNQKRLKREDLRFYAEQLGMEMERFDGCLDGNGAAEQLREDISHGAYLELSGTPRTYVNGRLFKGAVSEAMLEAAIQLELGEREAAEDGRVRMERTVVVEPGLPVGPVDMVRIEQGELGFWIDAVESSVDDQGRAVAQSGAVPPNVDWNAAGAACAAAGKRLCTAAEWTTACQGAEALDDDGDGSVIGDFIEGREYPYGRSWRSSHCHDSGDRDKGAALPTGIRGGCRTPEGVFDLTGNVQEWVGASEAEAVLLGGAWYYEEKASCGRAYDTFGAGFANRTTGFRCCADAAVAAPEEAPLRKGQALVAEGSQLPVFEGPALGGGLTGSAALEGRVAVVNFWASWCGPCRKELPALAGLSKRNPELAVLAINVDRDVAAAERFLGGQAPPFPVLLDPQSKEAGRFDVVSMPTTFLVDPEGRVVLRHEGWSEEAFADLEAQIIALQGAGD